LQLHTASATYTQCVAEYRTAGTTPVYSRPPAGPASPIPCAATWSTYLARAPIPSLKRVPVPAKCVHHVSEHPFTMSPVYTGGEGRVRGSKRQRSPFGRFGVAHATH